ncbi:MAG: hypothetical protein H6543_04490 [Prevotellaceae bacterium]|nr:hypothetical protein [Prevotellaceae bacterium]
MLLSDFNEIDKYLIDAKQLFQNISDIKDIEGDLSRMSDEQKAIIKQFGAAFLKRTWAKSRNTIRGNVERFI